MPIDLDTEVRTLLEARRGDWPRVCDSTGVSYSWISKFVRGKIPNPGYAKLKQLHAALSSDAPRRAAAVKTRAKVA